MSLAGCGLLACAEDSGADFSRRRDAGLADAASLDAAAADSGADADRCPRRMGRGLTQVPSEVIALAGESSCKTYPARFLLVNKTSADVRVEGLSTEAFLDDARFLASTETALPHTLKPNEAISVALELMAPNADDDTLIKGSLIVHYDDGCDWMSVKGLVEKQGVVGGGPWAVDMGVLAPGERGEPIPIVFGFAQVGDARGPVAKYFTRGVEPAPEFELVSGFGEAPSPCDELTAWVRFNAPARRGVVEGLLHWEFSDPEFSGLAEITLRGLVR